MPDVVSPIVLILLSPLLAAYDFVHNPAAPPQIFVAQFTEAFGHPPGSNIPRPAPTVRKRVYVTPG